MMSDNQANNHVPGALAMPAQAGPLSGRDPAAVVEMAEGGEVFAQDLRLPAIILLQANSQTMPPGAQVGQMWDAAIGEAADVMLIVPIRVKAQRRMFEPGSAYSSDRRPWCWSSNGTAPDAGSALRGPCGSCAYAKDDAVYSLVVLRVDGAGESMGLYLVRLGRSGAGAVGIIANGSNLRQRVLAISSERVTIKKGVFHAWRARPVNEVAMSATAAMDVDAAWQRWRSMDVPVYSPDEDATEGQGEGPGDGPQGSNAPSPPSPPPPSAVRTPPPVSRPVPATPVGPGVVATPGGRKKCEAHNVYLGRDSTGEWGHWLNVGKKDATWCTGATGPVGAAVSTAPAPAPAPTMTELFGDPGGLPF